MKILIFMILFFECSYGQLYRGSELRTRDSFLYGKFEARYKPAQGDGLVSSFFTYNDDNPNTPWSEIDIEILGVYDHVVDFNTITGGQQSHIRQHYVSFNPHEDFHAYGFEWTPNYVAWFIDGEEVYRQTGEHIDSLHYSQKLMMNIWNPVYEDWVGEWNSNILPRFSYYDYVSYAAYTPGEGDVGTDSNFTFIWKDDFDTFDYNKWEKSHDHTWGGNQSLFIEDNIHFEDGKLILCLTSMSDTGYVDNTAPAVLWSRQYDHTLDLRFSEEITSESAVDITNYSMSGVSFLDASLMNDLRTVTLIMDIDFLTTNVMGVFNIQDDNNVPNILEWQAVWIDIPEPLGDTIKINTGGSAVSGYLGDQIWGSDKEYGFVAGNFQTISSEIDIQNTENDIIYRSSLNRVVSYKVRLRPGIYTLKMLFSENHYDNPGDRSFDLTIEDALAVEDLDVLLNVQPHTAHNVSLNNLEVIDGVLDIYLSADKYGAGYNHAGPFINGLEIYLENALSTFSNVPDLFKLEKPYPNPFNNRVTLPIIINQKSNLSIHVFDLTGRQVDTIFDGFLQAGERYFVWDAKMTANGVYIIRSIINGKKYYDKIMLLK